VGGQEFPIAHHFYPICFGKCYSPFTYIHGPKGGTPYFKIEPSILERLCRIFFFSDRPIKLTNCQKNKFELRSTSYNTKHNRYDIRGLGPWDFTIKLGGVTS
jgi:hypothetical protein